MRQFEKRVLDEEAHNVRHAVVVPDHPAPFLHKGLEDQPQPLSQSGPLGRLDREVTRRRR